MGNDNYLDFPGLSYFFNKLKTMFATKKEISGLGQKGDDGISVESVVQTTTATVDEGINVITVNLSDGSSSSFNVQNGSRGSTGVKGDKGDAGAKGATGTRGSQIYSGTSITGTNTTAIIFSNSGINSALVNDLYINTNTWNIYQCTASGTASEAKWIYRGNIKGIKGDTGATPDLDFELKSDGHLYLTY